MPDPHAIDTLILLEDEPVPGHLIDELGVLNFSKIVAGVAKGTAGPFTIGIYGDWGHGKTSVLKQTRSLLNADPDSRIVSVLFNAWQFEHEQHPIVPLVATIVQAVDSKLAEWQSTPEKLTAAAATAFKSISRALRAIAYGFSANTKVAIPGFAEVEAGFVAKEMIDRYDHLRAPADPLLERTLYYNAFEALDKAAGTDGHNTPPEHKIVVFIDDLDRCLPPQALKLLESIKIVLAQRGFIFVLAVDPRIIQGYLTHRYEKIFNVTDYKVGPSYLDKLVQLPLNLPAHRGRFAQYIRRLLDERPAMRAPSNTSVREALSSLIDVLAVGSNHNPRSLVRFINSLIVDQAIWRAMEQEVDADLLGLCAISRILRQHLGDRHYHLLARSHDICQALGSAQTDRLLYKGELKPGQEPSLRDQNIRALLRRLEELDFLVELLKTPIGTKWLADMKSRTRVNEFLVQREQPPAESASTGSAVDRAIRQSLGLPPEAPIPDARLQEIVKLDLQVSDVGDSDLPSLAGMHSLQELSLDSTRVTDAGLEHLKALSSLQGLWLNGTQVTDAGLVHLKALTSLQWLWLNGTQVTDAGLEHLKALTSLQELSLDRTQVTDAGLVHLKALTSLQRLWLNGTQATDAGLEHLKALTSLQELSLNGTKVTEHGESDLKTALPSIRIIR